MDRSQPPHRKISPGAGIGSKDLSRPAVDTSTARTKASGRTNSSSPAATTPPLLFVHNSGSSDKSKWSVNRRAINAHVQKDQASKKRQAARQKLLESSPSPPTATQPATKSPPVATTHRIPISTLVNGGPIPEASTRLSQSDNSTTFTYHPNLTGSGTNTCPSCGLEMSSDAHAHCTPNMPENAATHWRNRSTHWDDADTTSAEILGGEFYHRHRSATPSPATSAALRPFANAAVPVTRRMSLVLDYWYNYLIPRVLPEKILSDEFNGFVTPLAVAEPMALFSLLALASFHYDTGGGSPTSKALYEVGQSPALDSGPPDYVLYKQKSIVLVNECMMSPSEAIASKTVFAIMCLIALGICGIGNTQVEDGLDIVSQIHGLQRLLSLRGGFIDIPIIATEQLYVAVYFHAATTKSPPPLSPPLNNFPRPQEPRPSRTMALALMNPPHSNLIHPALFSAITDLSTVMLFQTCARPSANPVWIPGLSLSDMSYVNLSTFHIIYTLLSIPFNHPNQGVFVPTHDPHSRFPITPAMIAELQECIRVSLLIFNYANWRMHDSSSPIFRTLTSQLKSSLDNYVAAHGTLFSSAFNTLSTIATNQNRYDNSSIVISPTSPSMSLTQPAAGGLPTPITPDSTTARSVHEILLWTLLLGAHISSGQRERPWFVLQVACGMRVLGLSGWYDLEELMQGFFYSEQVYGRSFRGILEEVGLLLDAGSGD